MPLPAYPTLHLHNSDQNRFSERWLSCDPCMRLRIKEAPTYRRRSATAIAAGRLQCPAGKPAAAARHRPAQHVGPRHCSMIRGHMTGQTLRCLGPVILARAPPPGSRQAPGKFRLSGCLGRPIVAHAIFPQIGASIAFFGAFKRFSYRSFSWMIACNKENEAAPGRGPKEIFRCPDVTV